MAVETTEFEELNPTELHLVKRGANGFPALLAKAAAEEVAAVKSECETCDGTGTIRDGNVTCPDCDGDDDDAEKGTMSSKDRNALPDSDFAYIDSKGGRHLPVNDEDHTRDALGRFSQTNFDNASEKKTAAEKIMAAARKFGIEVSSDSAVSEAVHGAAKAADDPGSPEWEQADAQTMAEAAELLLQASDKIKAFVGRETEEVSNMSDGDSYDFSDIWDGQDALSLITAALGVVARLSMQEAHEGVVPDGAAKAGRVLSAKSKTAVQAAIAALKDLLASAGEADTSSDAAKAGEDILTMTKEELFAALDERDAMKAAAAAEQEQAAKAETDAGAPSEDDATKSVAITLTPDQLEEVVTKGATKALSPLQERLEKVEAMAVPGGPNKTRTPATLAKSSSREIFMAQAEEYQRRADMTTEHELRKGYLEKAEEARRAADEIA